MTIQNSPDLERLTELVYELGDEVAGLVRHQGVIRQRIDAAERKVQAIFEGLEASFRLCGIGIPRPELRGVEDAAPAGRKGRRGKPALHLVPRDGAR